MELEPISLLSAHQLHLKARMRLHRRPQTLKAYEIYVGAYLRFLEERGIPPTLRALTIANANEFQDWVRSRSMGSRDGAAAERYALRIIKQFSRWLWRRGFFEHDPLARLELPHLPKLHRLPYGELEVRRLLSAAAASSRPTFGRALLLLQFDTGCRIGELCAADVDDVDLVVGAITFRHTKNGQTRRVIFGVDTLPGGGACVAAVAGWLRGRTAVAGCRALFTDVAGERTTWRQAHRYWAQLGAAAGVANPIPHRARHTHASELFAEMPGAELPLRARLGHLSRDVLEAYVTVPERAARKVANIASLSAKWAL